MIVARPKIGDGGFRAGSPVDWQNPITVGLAGAYVVDSGSAAVLYDSAGVAGNCTQLLPSNRIQFVREAQIPADQAWFAKDGVSSTSNAYQNTTYNLPNSNLTIVQVIRTTSNLDGSCFGNRDANASAAQRCQCNNPFSGAVYWDFGGTSAPNRVSFAIPAGYLNAWHTMVWTAGSTGMAIYVDVATLASNGSAATRTNVASGFLIGNTFNPVGGSNNCAIALHLLFTRILTGAEIARISRNPWMVFLPQPQTRGIRYFVPVTARAMVQPQPFVVT
jgi:hypothetical protein